VIFTLVAVLLAKSRYSDAWVRCRRAEPLSAAAEVQWDLLPPLAATADDIAVAGILEPAYSIGGDSFDYALNHSGLDFAIVDAMGHGMSAVLMAAAAINGFRNVRREGGSLPGAYEQVDRLIVDHFGDSRYVTGQLGSLDTRSGVLRWINAGHPLPLLVRNGTFAGGLSCKASMPMGLGGRVVEIAEEPLQRGDRVLFYTDGITESKSSDGETFGEPRLADYLVRATLDRVPVSETVRRLSAHVLSFVGAGLKDDATMFLVEYGVEQSDIPSADVDVDVDETLSVRTE
jgi:serine phosphatase RsbU (regulator of sigma subunit)